jgi:hypothetical protein
LSSSLTALAILTTLAILAALATRSHHNRRGSIRTAVPALLDLDTHICSCLKSRGSCQRLMGNARIARKRDRDGAAAILRNLQCLPAYTLDRARGGPKAVPRGTSRRCP